MRSRMSFSVPMDTDGLSPDSIKAAFEIAVDSLMSRADRQCAPLDWASLTMVLSPLDPTSTQLVIRTDVL